MTSFSTKHAPFPCLVLLVYASDLPIGLSDDRPSPPLDDALTRSCCVLPALLSIPEEHK